MLHYLCNKCFNIMTIQTRTTILNKSKTLFATNGYEGFSIRTLAKECGVGISSIYHFFGDKDELLRELFETTNKQLGVSRAKLPKSSTAAIMLKRRIKFQFEHIEDVVFVLKYYLHFRPDFVRLDSGYLPTKAYLHIEEVLEYGVKTNEFSIDRSEIDKESKVIAHAINGFLLEYYPNPPKGRELNSVVNSIHQFLMRSLTNKEALMK